MLLLVIGGALSVLGPGLSQAHLPDLTISSSYVTPSSPMTKDRLYLATTVANTGSSTATNILVQFRVNGTETLGDKVITSLAAGASTTVKSNTKVVQGATYVVSATVDPNNAVLESNENNNAASHAPAVSATRRTELSILDEYMARGDVASGTALPAYLLQRVGVNVPLPPPASAHDHENRTAENNTIILEHLQWHQSHTLGVILLTRTATANAWGLVDADPYGDEFLGFHRDHIGRYETFRLSGGYPELEPWAPPGCVPEHFAYPRETDWSCATGNPVPGPSLPTWATVAGGTTASPIFGYTALGQFETSNRLGKALEAAGPDGRYHGDVHFAVGQEFQVPSKNVKDPLFWGWHKFVDNVYKEWEMLSSHPELPSSTNQELLDGLADAFEEMSESDYLALNDAIRRMLNPHAPMHH